MADNRSQPPRRRTPPVGPTPPRKPPVSGKASLPAPPHAAAKPVVPHAAVLHPASKTARSARPVAGSQRPVAGRAAVGALPLPPRPFQFISPPVWERLGAYALLTRQHRPVGWLLLLWPTLWGLWLAAKGVPPIGTLIIFVLGVIVMRSAGCAINDYADRWLDSQVERTRDRPLAAGRVSPREALGVFAVLILVALGLVLLTNDKTLILAGGAAVLAVIYPFLKRHTYVPQLWLGAAFGMSIPMAFSAVTGEWPSALAWLAFTANILWSTAYDTFYAMVDRDDDLRAGAKSTAILFGDLDLVAVGIVQGCFLLAMALVGSRAELGQWYFGALGVAVLISIWQVWRARKRDREGCFSAFRHSHWVGLVLFAGMVTDYALRVPAPTP